MGGSVGVSCASICTREQSVLIVPRRTDEIYKPDNSMPSYYTDCSPFDKDVELAQASWHLITHDVAPGFLSQRRQLNRPKLNSSDRVTVQASISTNSCTSFFYDIYFEDLFHKLPHLQGTILAGGLFGKSRLLMRLIYLCFQATNGNEAQVSVKLSQFAEYYSSMGVCVSDYGVMGEVLLVSLSRCLGTNLYTIELHNAWTKLFSWVLRQLIDKSKGLPKDSVPSPLRRSLSWWGGSEKTALISQESATVITAIAAI